jgi:hypothetical protein
VQSGLPTKLATSLFVSEGRFYVACIGQFKRGKSTLINALIGEPILPVGFIPITIGETTSNRSSSNCVIPVETTKRCWRCLGKGTMQYQRRYPLSDLVAGG